MTSHNVTTEHSQTRQDRHLSSRSTFRHIMILAGDSWVIYRFVSNATQSNRVVISLNSDRLRLRIPLSPLLSTAVGCADLRLLKDAWIRRTKNEVVVGCNSTSQTWHLRCQGNQWIGVIGNCTQRKNSSLTVLPNIIMLGHFIRIVCQC